MFVCQLRYMVTIGTQDGHLYLNCDAGHNSRRSETMMGG